MSVVNEVEMAASTGGDAATATTIIQNTQLIHKLVLSKEHRSLSRVLRNLPLLRKSLSASILKESIESSLIKIRKEPNLQFLLSPLEPSSVPNKLIIQDFSAPPILNGSISEVEAYLALLVIVFLLDSRQVERGIIYGTCVIENCFSANLRSLDYFLAKLIYFVSRIYEKSGRMGDFVRTLLVAHRSASIKQDSECLASATNSLLRFYLAGNLYELAQKLVLKSIFPEHASNSQLARYLFYLGRINAIQLNYSESFDNLNQAIRKAPQSKFSIGFQQSIYKLLIIVQLLMGEMPKRNLFRQPTLKKALLPYLHLACAVRKGDLTQFQEIVSSFQHSFESDKTLSLILRLRQNVIKTGVRLICLSYSKISLEDIRKKLGLESREDAEYVVAKAIRDGVIDAVIDHEAAFVRSNEHLDLYSTSEPQAAFNQRINFCLALHNESVKCMRFPLQSTASVKVLEELRLQREGIEREIEGEFKDEDGMDL